MTDLAVSIRGLRKEYGHKPAVDGLDLDIRIGECFALLGPNGAGKTTTIEILEGYRKRTAGEVSVLDHDPHHAHRDWRERIGIVLQSSADETPLTAREYVSHIGSFYPNPKDTDEVLEAVGLTALADRKGKTMSGGERRRLDVALGLVGRPELLFLDEPTTGFDPEARRSFWRLIENLKRDGITILLTTHYLEEAEFLADRVGVITHGHLVALDTPEGLRTGVDGAVVEWRQGGKKREKITRTPTALIRELAEKCANGNGEIPDLEVRRPTLEDRYLQLVDDGKEES
ncbi:MAG: ABC transporter ATP-binding protein [Demequinaceae bacterium]|nr:ABC transporter ATP-binding protein [Demequinaceae bacterium]